MAGKYRLEHVLGQGGMGTVWRAEHLVLRSAVAIKLIHPRASDSDAIHQRFLREAQAAAQLRSPHVVQILDYGVDDATPFIVMELLEGESLAERLRRVGRLPPADTARILVHAARALQKAHEAGIVHRDLKPDNVFLVRNADEELIKVLDFGIAKSLQVTQSADAATQTGAVLGTPHYMSPEQARGNRAVDHRTDIWALGVIAFECLTGRRPFESPVLGDLLLKICAEPAPVPSQVASVPPAFDAWFARCTQRDPAARFGSVAEMAEALRASIGGSSLSLPAPPLSGSVPSAPYVRAATDPATRVPPSTGYSLPAPAAPSKPGLLVPVIVALGALVGLVAGTAVVLYLMRDRSPEPGSLAAGSSSGVDLAGVGKGMSGADGGARPAKGTGALASSGSGTGSSTTSGGASSMTDVQKALADAEKARQDGAKARADGEKARKEAEAERKKALESVGLGK